ncbi:uncharacterized protein LOC134531895 [Bacillus rossius redtenbacheri]|uniref:uncharacterized protein LOC134531895 n=1 Tax=Bacillus rossius redtenbacheri TaxID=93214 RepID=UPI002FDF045A
MGKAEKQHFEDQSDTVLRSPQSEASKMLEAALQQMDGIISGAKFDPAENISPCGGPSAAERALSEAAHKMVAALKQASPDLPPPPDKAAAALIQHWISQQIFRRLSEDTLRL